MKALLLYADRDFGPVETLPAHGADVSADLELGVLLRAMAGGDQHLHDIAGAVMLTSLTTPEQVRYRQDVLTDCLRHPPAVRAIYDLASAAVEAERRIRGGLLAGPDYPLHRSMQVMEVFLRHLRQLRALADEHAAHLTSAGFTRLCCMLRAELDDTYLSEIGDRLSRLRFKDGLLTSASLGPAGKGEDYVLRRPAGGRAGMLSRLSPASRRAADDLIVPDRDITGRQTLTSLRDRATGTVAGVLAQSCGHIRGFFDMLRLETGFYIGCLNLHDLLGARGQPLSLPVPLPRGKHALSAHGLRNPALLLTGTGPVVGNDISADGKSLIVITGANQGGKSTFLRSLGTAQLMMQAGLFVTAESFAAAVCPGVYTHFRRPEDATMISGKLDEELRRMSAITDAIAPGSVLLCNESFAATNEREGSQLARNVILAMLDCDVRVLLVTHFYDLASGFYADQREDAVFLRADREPDGSRTFRLTEGAPLLTSHARDIYDLVFGDPRV